MPAPKILKPKIKPTEMVIALGLTAGAFIALPQAHAQSFNCAKATRSAEFAICNSEDLIVLDEKMADAHSKKLKSFTSKPQRQAYSSLAKNWLKARNACRADFACLELRYREQISRLTGQQS